ncbi:hypothetical protein H4Q26_000072 [Puccinia striiformis f. sp. tritici PST-130]|nr:hypothetical protein H4Q26_000072 [Puccinia striiformis f. sp. tritici PST-130]
MDPHSVAVFYRMKLFLADLNHVLGAVIPFKHQLNCNHANFQNRSSDCRPTHQSRAWKRSWLPQLKTQIEGFKSQHTPKTCVVQLPLHTRPIESMYKEHLPNFDTPDVSQRESQYCQAPHYQYTTQPKQQYLEGPYTNEPDQQYPEQSYACGHYQQHFGREDYSERCSKGPADGSYIDGDLAFIKDVVSNYHSDLSKNCNNASVGHVFERKLPSDPDPESSDTTLQEAHPYIVQPDQQEPDFDMANCSATDIDCWASSLWPSITCNDQDEYIDYKPDNTDDAVPHCFETGMATKIPTKPPMVVFTTVAMVATG